MRPPAFWDNPPDRPGWQARLLAPLGAAYAAATARRLSQGDPYRPSVPVICVGNLSVGGTGKTPTVVALIERLTARGKRPVVVSRGYGGRLEGPVEVIPDRHKPAQVGDEPLLLAAYAPVVVAKDRAAGARKAEALGAEAILLDDGFQNPSLAKDLGLVVVDAEQGWGNGRCIPAGPLREPVDVGLSRADLVLSLGDPAAQAGFTTHWGHKIRQPLLRGTLKPLETGMDWDGFRALAFAGIGRPEKFFATLRGEGVDLVRGEPLDDHAPLSSALIMRLEQEAMAAGAQLVTTEKDAARLPPHLRARVMTLVVRLALEDPTPLDAALDRLFAPARTAAGIS